MFFEDEYNVMVAQFGTGDISIMPSVLDGDGDVIGSVSLIDNCGKCNPIGQAIEDKKWNEITKKAKDDTDLNTVIRLVFTEPESISVLIDALNDARDFMTGKKPAPTPRVSGAAVSRPLDPLVSRGLLEGLCLTKTDG